MEKLLVKIERYVLYLTVFLAPISFFYISPNPFVVSKLAVLVAGLSLFFLVFAIRIIISGKLEFVSGSFDLPAVILLVAYILSTVMRTPNKMEALLLPGTATIFVSGVLLYFAINQLEKEGKRLVSFMLMVSGTVFSLITLLAFTGLLAKIPQLPGFVQSRGFTPEGGYLPSAILLAVLLPLSLGFILSKVKKFKITAVVSSLLIVLALGVSIYNLLPGKAFSPRFLSYSDSWNIAIDSLKQSPILGIGPGNYLTAFNRFRTINYNNSDLWAIKFSTAKSSYMTIATEAGLLGVVGVLLILFGVYKMVLTVVKDKAFSKSEMAEYSKTLSLLILAVVFAFVPSTLTLLILFFIFLALSSKTHEFGVSLTGQKSANDDNVGSSLASKLPAFIVTLPLIGAVIYTDVNAARMFVAENTFKNAIEALSRNEASNTYDIMRNAITLNPRVDRYRISFSRVNLVLANAVAAKKDITDQDRTNITTLVQQAISEAKAAVALNPLRAGNWESLAQVYRAIAPLAKGADDFATQSYRQAVVLDPINPQTRIALGGMYFAKGDFENAVRVFELAVSAKPNHANARYNLAVALEKNGKLDRAISEMKVVLSLITNKDSKDYEVAKKALEDLQNKKKADAGSGEELVAPKKAETPILKPPLELPEEAKPPESPVSPAPTESVAVPSTTPIPAQ